MMKIKTKALEKIINESIDGVKNGGWETESTTIHEQDDVQVQIVVTRVTSEMVDGVCPEYENAEA